MSIVRRLHIVEKRLPCLLTSHPFAPRFNLATSSLRKMLRAMSEKQSTQKFETQREALLSQIDTMEQTNRRLREQVCRGLTAPPKLGSQVSPPSAASYFTTSIPDPSRPISTALQTGRRK
jgi:hypothetical protein